MRTFKMQYIKNGRDGVMLVAAKDRWDAIKIFLKQIRMEDPQAPSIGTLGTVKAVDDIGTIHVAWDNGSSLGVVLGVDDCRKVNY